MSVINKEPYINKILKLLTAEELETLQECINGAGSTPVFKSLVANSPYLLTTSDYGIYPVKLEIALQKSGLAQNVLEGYLIYKEDGEAEGTDLCALIAYASVAQQLLELYIMHRENGLWKWENKTCNLTIIDLRSEMFDAGNAGGGGGGDSSFIEVTDENRASIVQNIISMLEDISLASDDNNSKHYDVTYRFSGAEEDKVAMRTIWGSLDSEIVKNLIEELYCRRFQILTNGSYTLDYDKISYNYIRTSFDLKISIETNAETGDSQVVVDPCPRLFGDIRFVYDYEPSEE